MRNVHCPAVETRTVSRTRKEAVTAETVYGRGGTESAGFDPAAAATVSLPHANGRSVFRLYNHADVP